MNSYRAHRFRRAGLVQAGLAHAGLVGLLIPLLALFSCSSGRRLRAADIDRAEDSIVVGRISIRPGPDCQKVLSLPRMELRSVGQRTSIPYEIHDLVLSEKERRIDLPIAEKVGPGRYDIRIKVVEGSWDPTWLDAGMLTLVRFDIPKGFLVYFGTVEIDVTCEEFGKPGQAKYAGHTIGADYEFELNRFQEEHPEIFQMYRGRIIRSVPENPWKRS
jgi:hypothetical protein